MRGAFLIKVIFVPVLLAYPFAVYFGLNYFNSRVVAAALLVLMILRAACSAQRGSRRVWAMLALGVSVAACTYVLNEPFYLRLYPVLMSGLMLGMFAMSLFQPPSMIEMFARLSFKGRPMPAHVVTYTRNVTKVWCGFFILNGAVALYTVSASLETWTLYNGLISYLLMGGLFAGEFIYRHLIVKKRDEEQDA